MLATAASDLELQQLAASIKAWSGFVADVAKVEVQESGRSCRIALTPFVPGACPVEILFDGSNKRCDLRVGEETFTGWALPSLDIVLPLIEAVAEGRVVTRYTSSATTGLALAVSTHIRLADGNSIAPPPSDLSGGRPVDGDIVGRDTHYLPYRKPQLRP